MLNGSRTTSGNRYTYVIFMDSDLVSSEWGAQDIFSSYDGGFAKNN